MQNITMGIFLSLCKNTCHSLELERWIIITWRLSIYVCFWVLPLWNLSLVSKVTPPKHKHFVLQSKENKDITVMFSYPIIHTPSSIGGTLIECFEDNQQHGVIYLVLISILKYNTEYWKNMNMNKIIYIKMYLRLNKQGIYLRLSKQRRGIIHSYTIRIFYRNSGLYAAWYVIWIFSMPSIYYHSILPV